MTGSEARDVDCAIFGQLQTIKWNCVDTEIYKIMKGKIFIAIKFESMKYNIQV